MSASRWRRAAAREGAIVALAAFGSALFTLHQSFYSGSALHLIDEPAWAFLLVTGALYVFIRALFLIGGTFFPRQRPEFILCPECGRVLDDLTPRGVEEHRRIELTPKPTEREILAAVMLRKAIDDARRSSRRDLAGPAAGQGMPPSDVENPPVSLAEFDRILRDLDQSRARRGPGDRRPRGPGEGPPPGRP